MILLDTHALVWLSEGLPALGKQARKIADQALAEDGLAVSAISFWEIALLHQKERITLNQGVSSWRNQLLEFGLHELPVDGGIGNRGDNISGLPCRPRGSIHYSHRSYPRCLLTHRRYTNSSMDWQSPTHQCKPIVPEGSETNKYMLIHKDAPAGF